MRDTGKAQLPGLMPVATGNPALDRLLQAIIERLEVREGSRGNPYERVLTLRDLKEMGLENVSWTGSNTAGDSVLLQKNGGLYARVSVDAFAERLRNTRLYKDLLKKLDDPTRFETMPQIVQDILLQSITDEAIKRGADIQRTEEKIQTATDSLAMTVTEITAAVAQNAAGIRDVEFAYAAADQAQAATVTQLVASLDGTGSATMEESLQVIADRTEGLSGQYMLKINAGGAVAGIGLMASEDPDGNTESAFIVQADMFAVMGTGLDEPVIPFGIDTETSTVFINGQVRIAADGPTIEQIGKSITLRSNAAGFKVSTSNVATPASITFTATLNNGLTGVPVFSVIYGNATLLGTGLTRTVNYSSMTTDQVTVRASIIVPATETTSAYSYDSDVSIFKVFDGANGAAGAAGATGPQGIHGYTGPAGAIGTRGSVTRYGSGPWSDSTATSLLPDYAAVIGDTVTLTDTSVSPNVAVTKYWSGSAWVNPGVIIDGNLLVNGSISGDKLAANSITAGTGAFNKAVIGLSGFSAVESRTFVNGVYDITVSCPTGIGTPIYTLIAQPPANMTLGHSLYFNTATSITVRVTAQVSGVPYSGSLSVGCAAF